MAPLTPQKRIAIFCDGTWNRQDARTPTHVATLSRAVLPTAGDGTPQIAYYQRGVGSGRGTNRIARAMDKLLGGALGWGLDDNVLEAYANLVMWYEPGDEIFIFGFSRGAYTARSLAGLIRTGGIPPRAHLGRVGEAMELYRLRGKDHKPDSPICQTFRHAFAPRTATSQEDLTWRRAQGDTESFLLTIKYLGVWDTVGALGLPGVFGKISELINKRYLFHDTYLSRSVAGARHAVAIDERRKLYKPVIWENTDTLNGTVTGHERPYQEKWFPGVHSVVGGSGPVPGLSGFTAQWVAEGASDRCLAFDPDALGRITQGQDATADDSMTVQRAGLGNLFGYWLDDRDGPKVVSDLSEAAQQRYRAGNWRPGALSQVSDQL